MKKIKKPIDVYGDSDYAEVLSEQFDTFSNGISAKSGSPSKVGGACSITRVVNIKKIDAHARRQVQIGKKNALLDT